MVRTWHPTKSNAIDVGKRTTALISVALGGEKISWEGDTKRVVMNIAIRMDAIGATNRWLAVDLLYSRVQRKPRALKYQA